MKSYDRARRGLAGVIASWPLAVGLVLGLLFEFAAVATPPPYGVAPVLVPAGGFAIDGDLQANTPSANAGDWVPDPGGTGGSVLDALGTPLNPATTFHFIDPYNSTADNTFAGGLKWTDDPGTWQWTTSKASSKTDINNVMLHVGTDTNGHTWVIVAADRFSTSGDSYIDFEFLQSSLVANTNGTFTSAGTNGGRTVNDLLLSLGFTSGGSVADFFAWRWLTNSATGGFTYTDSTASLPVGRVFVAANSNTVAVPFGAFGSTTYGANAFAEAAVDLTELLGNFNPCVSVGFKTIMVKTKSSQSSTATIVDFINPVQYSLNVGPSASAGPNQTQCTQGASTAFTLNGSAAAGIQPIASTAWSVLAGSATIDSPSSLVTTAYVASASATLRLSVIESNGCTETSDVVLTVAPLPVCSITGSSVVCPKSTNQFAAPAGLSRYAWSISGNGTISGATNAQTVSVKAGLACAQTFTLSLTVTTTNGCSSTCSNDILVNDTVGPTLTLPADRVLECPANTTTNATGVATAQDNCSQVTVSYSDSVSNTCGGAFILWRTWSAVDLCGNSTNAVQTITVQDTTRPVITCPPSRVLQCPANTATNATGVATATDTCSAVVITYSDSVTNGCGNTATIARTWTATDACGNSSSCVQTITVQDTNKPSITCPPDLVLECPADTSTNNTGVATGSDTCSSVTITYSDAVTNGCSGTETIIRTWTATDQCGNSSSCAQKIVVRDTTKPTITCPPNLVLECPADTSTNNTGVATATDTCSQVSIRYSDSVTNGCSGTKVIARTWTATDACSNSISCVQTITVQDTTKPTITCPPDVILECPANTTTNATGVATATDSCSQVSIRYSDSVTNGCSGTKVIARTWTATDACGNSASCVQTITVQDTTKPTITCPPDRVLECPANTSTNATGVASATDTCSAVVITYSDSVTNGCTGTEVIGRTWTATDACGNSAACVQTITVRDTTKPVITCPSNRILQCPANTSTNATGVATATDTCSAVVITYSDSVTNGCGNTATIARTWTATDACGNSSSCVQTITVQDTNKPSITCPPDLVLECPADTSTNSTGMATASDTCSSVTITFSDAVTNGCSGTETIIRTWTATDQCGNSSSCAQKIVVRDTTKPTITCPPDVVLECPADTSTNSTGVATATDTCSQVTIRYSDATTNKCGATKVIARTWTATDACGNSASCVQTITVQDTTKPIITCPADLVLECPANTATNATGVATATDTCSAVVITYSDSVTNGCSGTKVIARTWTATDACGNSASCVQNITVRDTTKPTITCPPDVVLECPANTSTNNTGVATATDTCSQVTISYSDSVTNGCSGTEVIARMWRATDACGNSASCVQTITVRDTTKPTITCPPNLVLQCPANTSTNATGVATATDTCSAVAITYSDSVTNGCSGTKTIARTWMATDACGNSSSCVQTITVQDTGKPAITCPPDIVLECPANTTTNATGVPVASDTCSAVTVTYTDSVSNTCGGSYVITRNWTAADQCGNSSSCTQKITVRDTTAPALILPASLVLQCPADTTTNSTGVATATDRCSQVTVRYADSVTNNCGNTKIIARTWTATDACGNSTNAVQLITVRDTTPPALTIPPNLVLECPADPSTNNTGVATAQDTCSSAVVSYTDSITNNCGGGRTIVRTWTAADQCGNTTNRVQLITLRDTTKPTITCPPSVVLECPADTSTNANGVATAQDTCSAVTVSYSDSISNICGVAKVISRTWTATDACGNSSSCVQTLTVRDTTNPTILCPPDVVLECGASTAPSATGNATGWDTCNSVTVTYSDSISNMCGGSKVISRTWTATDACGNKVSCLQTITVQDTTPPALTLPADRLLQCPANTATNSTGVPTVVDRCSAVTVTYSDVVSNGCAATKTVWRTWTAVDACGNSTNGLQTIMVIDTTKPTITCPKVSVQCVTDIPPAYPDLATFLAAGGIATDTCSSNLVFSQTSDSGLVGKCPGTVTRVYRVTDACGNFNECTQTITVDDTIPPVITCPTDVFVECGSSLDPTNIGRATATDNCTANPVIAYSDSLVQSIYNYNLNFYAADPAYSPGPNQPPYARLSPASLPCPDSALLTGRAADPLRNAVAFGPTANQLAALTSLGGVPLSFGQIVPYEVVIGVSGNQGAGHGTLQFSIDWSTYTTSNDRFGFDTNYMVYCAFVDTADLGTIDPNHYAKVDSYSSKLVNPGTLSEAIEGTFQVSGLDVGNQIIVEIWLVMMSTQPAHVGGTIASQIASAQSLDPNPQPVSTGSKTISLGNLGKMTSLPTPPQQQPGPTPPPPPPPVPGVAVAVVDRTWTATDDCGNVGSCVQRITVRDTTPPVITAPPDLVLQCPATDTSTNVTGTAVAQDVCGSVTALTYSDVVSNVCGGSEVISRTWTATDDSGNSTNVVQTITVTSKPTITCPPDMVLECPADTTTNATGVATATDPCSAVLIAFTDAVTNGCGGTEIIARTWTATDACGNSASCVQTITVSDTTKPVLTCPPDLVLECPASTSTNNTGVATATDTCSAVTISYSDSSSNLCSGQVIARTWVATDACGNSASCVQIITVRDTTKPVITCPPDVVLECPADTSTNNTGVAVATDTCSQVTISYSDVSTNSCSGAQTITRTWTAADACGNSASCLQTITVRDTTPPTITCSPDRTVSATDTWSFDQPSASDTCSTATILVLNTITNRTDTNTMIATRTWVAADACGNTNTCRQSITVLLGQVPLITSSPHSGIVGYSADLTLTVSATSATPCVYQWQVGGMNIAGATGSVLTLHAMDYTNAGVYCVIISNAAGAVCSSAAVIDVRPWLYYQSITNGMTLNWPGPFILQSANTAPGPYVDVPSSSKPYTAKAAVPPQQFFRLRSPAYSFTSNYSGGQFTLSSTGVLGCNFIFQASTNSTDWVNLATNPSPYIFIDANASQYPNRVYRAVMAQPIVNPPPPVAPSFTANPAGQTATYGNGLTLTAGVNGSGPFAYQWQVNGLNIPGATDSSFSLTSLQFSNAGLYTVVISNAAGVVTSAPAVVNVGASVTPLLTTAGLQLTWPSPFVLQTAPQATGAYTDLLSATSPYLVDTSNGPRNFFRLRSPPISFVEQYLPEGSFSMSGPGVPGYNFVFQASTDLVHWVNLQTNVSPLLFIDTNAWQYPRRFYRAAIAH